MGDNLIMRRSYEFALEVIEIYRFLTEHREEKESVSIIPNIVVTSSNQYAIQ